MKENYLNAIVELDQLNKKTSFERYPAQSEIVDLFWSIAWDLEPGEVLNQKILPNPHINMVVYDEGTYLEGVVKSYFNYTLSGKGKIFGIKFRIGGLKSLCSTDAMYFMNKKIPVEEILTQPWHTIEKVSDKLTYVESLLKKARPYEKHGHLGEKMVEFIESQKNVTTLEQISHHFNMSKRSIQRLFHDYVGVNPKWVIRMSRLREIKSIAEENQIVDWTGLAQELGYTDQSHMIRDFKSIVGKTPKVFQADHK